MRLGKSRVVMHLNVADFAVAVEAVREPKLRERPVLVAAEGSARALVYDVSEEAYRAGVCKGMRLSHALRVCPDATLLPLRPELYAKAMQALLKQVMPYSPLIELMDDNGHLYVDLTGTGRLWGPPQDVAWRMKNEIQNALGLNPCWGLAANKLVAKIATRLCKPVGEYVVSEGAEGETLKPLALALLPGIEAPTLQRCDALNVKQVSQVVDLNFGQLEVMVGSRAEACSVRRIARGEDDTPVLSLGERPPVVKTNHTLATDTNDAFNISLVLRQLVEHAGAQLRQRGFATKRLGLCIDYADGKRVIRSATMQATANDFRLMAAAELALKRAWTRRTAIQHLALTCDRLTYPPVGALLFPDEQEEKEEGLVSAIDTIRSKFGWKSIARGTQLSSAV